MSTNDEDELFEKYSETDSTELVDWSQARKVPMPKLRPSLKTISIRLPETMIFELKRLANKRDVPYQALIKLYIAENLKREIS